ncbi:MAG TPA: cytochrome P450 [Kofleriaceae bacterium]|nr:cytochrome P450 [Kofleriaceae bacterium]
MEVTDDAGTSLPPGPTAPAWWQTATYARDPVTALERWAARHGDLFTVRIVGMPPLVFAAAPAELRQIFTASPAQLEGGAASGQVKPIVGARSVLTLDGDEHHRHRRMMLPPFHGERMATYAAVMRDVTRRSMATWPVGRPFALHPHLLRITLEVILRTVFGIDAPARLDTFAGLFASLVARWSSPLLPMLALYGIDPIRLAPWLPVARDKQALDRALREEIARRGACAGASAAGAAGAARAGAAAAGTDIFSLLLAARDDAGQPLTAEELRDELVTLMVAGHETSATALAWAFERLLVHPDVLARVRAELATITGADGAVDVARAGELPYLDAVVRETLRQRPILAFVARRAAAPFELGGYRVPAGTYLCPAIHLAHRRAESYPQPERFEPERFVGKKVDPYVFLPFGGGGRRCLGMAFALVEIKVILATVLSSATLALDGGRPLARALRGITVAPAGGTRVIRARSR